MTTEVRKVHLTGTRCYLAPLLLVITVSVGVTLLAVATDSWPTTIRLLAAVVAIGLIFSRPTVGLWLLLVTLPFQRIDPINLPIGALTLPRSIALLTMVALVAQYLVTPSERRRSFRTPIDGALLALITAWLASSVMSIRINPDPEIQAYIDVTRAHLGRQQPFIKSYTEIMSYLISVVVLYIMSGLLTSAKLIHSAIRVWVMGAIIACLIGLYATIGYYSSLPVPEWVSNTYYFTDPGSFADVSRLKSVASEPRFFTYYLVTILPFLILAGLRKQYVISRRFHLGAVALVGLSFCWTMSRSMILLGLVMAVFMPIIATLGDSKLSRRNRIGTLVRTTAALAILVSLAAVLLFIISDVNFSTALTELAATINPFQRAIASQLINNIMALNLFLKNPVLGVGIGNFAFYTGPSAVPSWSPTPHDPTDSPVFVTSVYLQTLSEVGIVGFVVLLYLFGTIGRLTIRIVQLSRDETWTATAIGLMGSFLMIVVAVAFIPNFFYPETWVVLGFIAVVLRHVASGQKLGTMTRSETSAEALQLPPAQAASEFGVNNGNRRHA